MQLDESGSASTTVSAREVTFGSGVLRTSKLSDKKKLGWYHV